MSKNILEEHLESFKPGIHSILEYGRSCGLEGEETTLLCGTIAFHGADVCIMVGGASQAGKTHLSELVMSAVVPKLDPPKEIVNNRELLLREGGILALEFGSKTAIAYNEEKFHLADGLYVPEYQKLVENGEASKLAQEALKSFGEGRDVHRDVTNVYKKDVDTQVLKRSNFWTNLATENPLKLDVETGNRVLPLFVDVSADQTLRIMLHKAKREFIAGRQVKMPPEETLAFKHFMKRYRATKGVVFENPFADYIAEHYLPHKYIKSRRAIDFYIAFNRAICKWHYLNGDRISFGENGVMVNIEDIYQTEEIYGAKCRFDMLQLDPNSMEIFKIFSKMQENPDKKLTFSEDDRVQLDISTIHKQLSQNGINMKINVVEQMLDELQECGYLEYSTGMKSRGSKYMIVDVEKPVNSVIDYQAVFQHGCDLVAEWLPDVFEEWRDAQLKDGKLLVRNPFNGQPVDLRQVEVPKAEPAVKKEAPVVEKKPKNLEDFKVKWS